MKPYLETIKRIKLKAGYNPHCTDGRGNLIDIPARNNPDDWYDFWRERKERMQRKQARAIDKQHKAKYLVGKQKYNERYGSRNTSLWCTPLIELVIDFAKKELEKRGGYPKVKNMQFVHTTQGGHGHAGWKVHIAHDRYRPRMNWKYCGISWAKDNATKTGLQSLCHIVAHELVHTTNLAPYEYKNGRRQIQSMEFKTDNIAAEIVTAFAKEEKKVWSKYRKLRRTARNKVLRAKAQKQKAKQPDHKLQLVENNLDRWEKKLAQAKKKVKTYKTKLNRMNGARKAAATRKAAACKR